MATDQETVDCAIEEAQKLLTDYIRPGVPRDCGQTINRLLQILDHRDVVAALKRLDDHHRGAA